MLSIILKKIKSDSYNMLKTGYQHLQESQSRSSQIENILANKMIESKIELKNMANLNMKESTSIIAN